MEYINKFPNDKFIYVFLLFILFSFFIKVKANDNNFLKLKELSTGEYFVIFEKSINIYNSDFTHCSSIFSFNNSDINPNLNNIDNITISEYYQDENQIYVLCLINEYLFIYNYINNNLTTHKLIELKIYLTEESDPYYYNFIPYKVGDSNDIYFIVSLIHHHRVFLFKYYIESFQNVIFGDSYQPYKVDISRTQISCQIIYFPSIHLECFSSYDRKKQLINIEFDISTSQEEKKDLKSNDFLYYKIKSSISFDNKKKVICTIDKFNSSSCLHNIQEIQNENYELIGSTSIENCNDFDIYFFNETNQFVLICKQNNNAFKVSIINYISDGNILESDGSIKEFTADNCQALNSFSVIYNKTINNYNLITDCNFTNCKECPSPSETIIETTLTQIPEKDTTDTPTYNEIITSIIDTMTQNIEHTNIITNYLYPSETMTDTTDITYKYQTNEIWTTIVATVTQSVDQTDIISDIITNKIIVDKNEEIIKSHMDISMDDINDNMKKIIESIEVGKNYEIEGKDFTLKIRPTNSTLFNNETHVEFDECERKLRESYNISNSTILTFFQFEIDNNDAQSYIKQVEYQTYNDKMVILDLSVCKDINIKIVHEIKDGVTINENLISSFENMGVNVFDINDSFFNDLCTPYSNNGNDIILQDRIKDYYQNYSLCNHECTYNSIDFENMTVACDCIVKEKLSTIITPLNLESIKESSISDSNIGVIKCYNLVFSLKNKMENIGFWIFLVLIIINIIFLCLFFKKGLKKILVFIFNEMKKYGYINKDSRFFFEENKKEENISNPIKNNKNNNKESQNNKRRNKKKIKKKINFSLPGNRKSITSQKLNLESKNELNKLQEDKLYKKNKIKIKKSKAISNLATENSNQKNNNEKDKEYIDNFSIIKIDLNNIDNYVPHDSSQTLHNYTFEEAIRHDRRSIFKILYIYLLSRQIIFHTFFQKNPLEPFSLRICLFIFMISTDLALNSLLYFNDRISEKYHNTSGLFLFTFSNNLTIILLSTILSFFLITLISKLGNSTNAIRSIFGDEEEKIKQDKKYKIDEKRKKEIFLKIEKILKVLKIKIVILFIIEIILILLFWYFVTAFCHVYSSTQASWLLDSFLSFLSRFVIELLFALLYAKLYIISVSSNVYCIYRALLFIYDLS